jgi:hypothetical protein
LAVAALSGAATGLRGDCRVKCEFSLTNWRELTVCRKISVVVGTGLLALVCLGCGDSGPEIASVEGKVTLDGAPLPNAAVVFIPENGRPAGATTDADGNYVLNFTQGRQGAIPGKNKVQIRTARDRSETPDGTPIPAVPEKLPIKYNTQSTLEFDVKPGEKNIANFELESGGAMPPPDTY